VKYVLVDSKAYGDRWTAVEQEIAALPDLELKAIEGTVRVYSLSPRSGRDAMVWQYALAREDV
jgi:hypothetical protein